MEIGEELVDDAERLAGIEENRGFGFSGSYRAAVAALCGFFGGVFQGADDCGADGEDWSLFLLRFRDCLRGDFGDFVRLDVDFVIFEALGADRFEGAQAYVEGYLCNFDIAGADALQNFRREVQTRRGRGYGASLPRVDGLVALAVGGLVGTLDVRRQGNVAEAAERFVETGFRGEAQDAQAKFAAAFGYGFEFRLAILGALAENNFFAHRDFPAGAHQSFPCVWRELAHEQDLDGRFQVLVARRVMDSRRLGVNSHATAEQPCGQDASVVEDDQFIAAQQIRKFAEVAVVPRAGGFIEQQHAGGVTRGQRMLRDALRRQVEI